MNVSPAGSAFCASCGAPFASAPGLTPATNVRPRVTPPGTDPLVGRVVAGRFKVLELLGQGGMGKVYKALHLGLDKVVCLKTLRPVLADDPTLVGRFEREAKAASRLNHPNSIQVLDFGQDEEGTLFLVMEFVEGRDLRRLLRDEFPLSEQRIVHVMAQVLSALAEAHAQNVIHRDLKPENIMIEQRRDAPDHVKVLDFGIAKIQDGRTPGLTRQDLVCGTPEYMSPEQAQGLPFDRRADLYAIGVILYQLATGTLPFDGDSAMQVLTKQVHERPEPPRARKPDATISPALEALILRAIDKDPAKRPQTADEFRRELLSLGKAEVEEAPKRKPARTLPPDSDDFDAVAALPKSHAPLYAGIAAALAIAGGVGFVATRPEPEAVIEKQEVVEGGGLTLRKAYDVIESHFDDVRGCFVKASKKLNEDGKVLLTLAIGAEGEVERANIAETSFQAPALEKCILQKAVLWQFDKPRGGSLFVSYPYIFKRR